MRVRVLFFAILKDAAQTREAEMELPEGATVSSLVDRVAHQFPGLQRYIARVAFAVNQAYAPATTALHDGDEVALIPPVSGGSGDEDPARSRIREILLNDWDPTNASRSEAARTAYDDDIDPILGLLRTSAGEEALVDYLYDREREIMCFPGLGKQRLRRIARLLIALEA